LRAQGERAGLIHRYYGPQWLDRFVSAAAEVVRIGHTEVLREAGSEGIECIMWLIMRGALNEQVKMLHRFDHAPVSNTAYGLMLLENQPAIGVPP